MNKLITVPKGLVFVTIHESGSRTNVYAYSSEEDFDFSYVRDLIVLQSNEYCIVGISTGNLFANTYHLRVIANNNGQVYWHNHGEWLSEKNREKKMARWHARMQKLGYVQGNSRESDTVFNGVFDDLRESAKYLLSLRRSATVDEALKKITHVRREILLAKHLEQQSTPDEIARAEAIKIAQIGQDAADWQAALLAARAELNELVTPL